MRRAGFTLIELLVVIAIIAILAAILFPVFARARARAMQNTCLSNVKQITLGLMMYASDNDQRFPIHYASYGQSPSWAEAVHPYIKNYQLWFCPDEKSPMYMANGFPPPQLLAERQRQLPLVLRACGPDADSLACGDRSPGFHAVHLRQPAPDERQRLELRNEP